MQKNLPPIRLMLVDDHALVRMGFAALLETQADIRVVAETGDGAEAIKLYERHHPDVVLLDLRMPGMDGIENLKRLLAKWPDARVVMLTTSDLEDEINRAIECGASGYLLKKITRDELIDAVRLVHSGEACIPQAVARQLATSRHNPRLSDREREVLALLPRGLTNPDISTALGISLSTTKTHLRTIFSKLDVADRSEAVTVAMQRGIIQLDSK